MKICADPIKRILIVNRHDFEKFKLATDDAFLCVGS